MPYLKNSIAYDYDSWYTLAKWLYLQVFFFYFLKIFIFWGCLWGKKRVKMAQNDKKLCVTFHISVTIHLMIVIYGTDV